MNYTKGLSTATKRTKNDSALLMISSTKESSKNTSEPYYTRTNEKKEGSDTKFNQSKTR